MDFVGLLICSLATWQAIEIWNHSSIFATQRSRAAEHDNWLGRLLTCPFCLSVWVAYLCVIAHAFEFLYGFVIFLAVSRLANLGNDLLHPQCRTPNTKKDVANRIENLAQISAFVTGKEQDGEGRE